MKILLLAIVCLIGCDATTKITASSQLKSDSISILSEPDDEGGLSGRYIEYIVSVPSNDNISSFTGQILSLNLEKEAIRKSTKICLESLKRKGVLVIQTATIQKNGEISSKVLVRCK
jgi:hypothetical protein